MGESNEQTSDNIDNEEPSTFIRSVALERPEDEHVPKLDLLSSPPARDCRWFFRARCGAMGFKASSPEPSSRSSSFSDMTTRNPRHLDAVREERRILVGIEKLQSYQAEILRIGYEARQRTADGVGAERHPDLRNWLGAFHDLALSLSVTQEAYRAYAEKCRLGQAKRVLRAVDRSNGLRSVWADLTSGKLDYESLLMAVQCAHHPELVSVIERAARPWSIERWVVELGNDPGKCSELQPFRDETERVLGSALAQYHKNWKPPLDPREDPAHKNNRVSAQARMQLRFERHEQKTGRLSAMLRPVGWR